MNDFDFLKTKTNRLKRKLNKFNKNFVNTEEINSDLLFLISQNFDSLENLLDIFNATGKKEEELKELVKKDIEATKIIDKFLPLMLMYQMNS
jgi:hypothetical protein